MTNSVPFESAVPSAPPSRENLSTRRPPYSDARTRPSPSARPSTRMGGASEMIATREEMRDAKLDIGYRDFCAHLLIPLNECRRASYFLPWKCEHERHVYEKCQYKE